MVQSKWTQGVDSYSAELYQKHIEEYAGERVTLATLLNGAKDWKEYSYGGSSELYDQDIAERLATPSEIKSRTRKDGSLNNMANANETWLDVQARALHQAAEQLTREIN